MKHRLFSILLACCLPLSALASMHITNNTNHFASGHIGKSDCTSKLSPRGAIPGHGDLVVPKLFLKLYCRHGCNVDIYMNKACTGDSIATVQVDEKKGIVSVNNHNSENYSVVGSGQALSINGGPAFHLFR